MIKYTPETKASRVDFAIAARNIRTFFLELEHLKNTKIWCCYTKRWSLQQLHSKTVLAHIGVFPNKCTRKHPFHVKILDYHSVLS